MLKNAYSNHKADAKRRGIPFLFSYQEWLEVWENSGHLHHRGRGRDKFCMARFGDSGPYSKANVKIIKFSENITEGHLGKRKPKIAESNRNRIWSKETKTKLAMRPQCRWWPRKTVKETKE